MIETPGTGESRDSFGDMRAPLRWKAFRSDTHDAAMTAPSNKDTHTARVDPRYSRTEFAVRCPVDVTAYTIRWGRWLEGPKFKGTGTELGGWCEDGLVALTGQTEGELSSVIVPNNGDRTAVYVTDLTGTPGGTFMFWLRGLP